MTLLTRFSLKNSIPVLMIVLSVSFGLIAFLYHQSSTIQNVEDEQVRWANKLMKRLQGTIEHAVYEHNDFIFIQKDLTYLKVQQDITTIFLVDNTGVVVAAKNMALIGKGLQSAITSTERGLILSEYYNSMKHSNGKKAQIAPDEKSVFAIYPIVLKQKNNKSSTTEIGYLYADLSMVKVKEEAHRMVLGNVLFYSGIGVAFAFVLWGYFYLVFNRRANHLIEITNRLAEGEKNVLAKLSGNDELKQIADAFNNLVTERNRADDELIQSSLEWTTAIDASRDVIYLLDLESRLLRANMRFYSMIGAPSSEEVEGEYIDKLVHPGLETCQCPVCCAQEEKKDAVIVREPHSAGNTTDLPVEIIVQIIRDDSGEPLSILVMQHDLTFRRQAEADQQQLHKYQSLNSMAAGIAHNYNNILTAVLGNMELALDILPTELKAREYIEISFEASQRAAMLSTKMLQFVGQSKIEMQNLEVTEFVQVLMEILKPQIKSQIDTESAGTNKLFVNGDFAMVQQVIVNLVTNADESFTNQNIKNPLISIQYGLKNFSAAEINLPYMQYELLAGEYVYLKVTDNGPGMSPEQLMRAFEPFFTTRFTGRGMGLASSLGIMRSHKGTILLESVPGKGTSATVLFPAIPAEIPPAEQDPHPGPVVDNLTHTGKVLVADDEQIIRDLNQKILNQIGFDVLLAADGQEALDLFEEHKRGIDLILLDISMPRLNGIETLRIIREQSNVPVIIVTGYSVDEVAGQFITIANTKLIQKPFGIKELKGKIIEVLHLASANNAQ